MTALKLSTTVAVACLLALGTAHAADDAQMQHCAAQMKTIASQVNELNGIAKIATVSLTDDSVPLQDKLAVTRDVLPRVETRRAQLLSAMADANEICPPFAAAAIKAKAAPYLSGLDHMIASAKELLVISASRK